MDWTEIRGDATRLAGHKCGARRRGGRGGYAESELLLRVTSAVSAPLREILRLPPRVNMEQYAVRSGYSGLRFIKTEPYHG